MNVKYFIMCIHHVNLILYMSMHNDNIECAGRLSKENKVLIILKYLITYHSYVLIQEKYVKF